MTNLNDSGAGSLRDAIGYANSVLTAPGGEYDIYFDSSLTANGPATITLNSPLEISNSNVLVVMWGSGNFSDTPDAGWQYQAGHDSITLANNTGAQTLLSVDPGAAFADVGVNMNLAADNGGEEGDPAIANAGTAYIENAILFNSSGGSGISSSGASFLYQDTFSNDIVNSTDAPLVNSGTATIEGCTFDHNGQTGGQGSVVNNSSGSLNIYSSTFADNQGTAIYSDNGLYMVNSTVACNSGGYGVEVDSGTDTLYSNIIADNEYGDENDAGAAGSNNIIGVDPELAPLGYYGGPTETMPPNPSSSPAIGQGLAVDPTYGDGGGGTGSYVDQRGYPLPDAGVDVGAFQWQYVDFVDPGYIDINPNTSSDDPVSADQLSVRDSVNLDNALGDFDLTPLVGVSGDTSLDPYSYLVIPANASYISVTVNTGDEVTNDGGSNIAVTLEPGGDYSGSFNSLEITDGATYTATGSNPGAITVDSGGTLNVAAGASLGSVIDQGSVNVDGSATLSSLTISAGGVADQTSTNTSFGASVITVGSLSIASPSGSTNGGQLDLGNGDLIVRSTAAGSIEPLLAAGYDGGYWDGLTFSRLNPAAIVSSAAANDPYQVEGLGYAQVGSASGDLAMTSFDGEPVSSGDIVVGLTYYGDVNLDRTVNGSEYTIIDNARDLGLGGWNNGDSNFDGKVDAADQWMANRSIVVLTAFAVDATPNPNGTFSGGSVLQSVNVSSGAISGSINISTGVTLTIPRPNLPDLTRPNGFILDFNGNQPNTNYHWMQFITRSATLATGAAATGSYVRPIKDGATGVKHADQTITDQKTIFIARNFNTQYLDTFSTGLQFSGALKGTKGEPTWDHAIGPNESARFDAPTESKDVASEIITLDNYLICNNAVVYHIRMTLTYDSTHPNGVYNVVTTKNGGTIPSTDGKVTIGIPLNDPSDPKSGVKTGGDPIAVADPTVGH